MHKVTSKDGSRIAYDRFGSGPAVILVGGALSYRKYNKMEELATLLAERCTVVNYDRRGRGDSTEVKPFALEREIEDIAAQRGPRQCLVAVGVTLDGERTRRSGPYFALSVEAGDGDRTRTKSLEGSCAAITPRPRSDLG